MLVIEGKLAKLAVGLPMALALCGLSSCDSKLRLERSLLNIEVEHVEISTNNGTTKDGASDKDRGESEDTEETTHTDGVPDELGNKGIDDDPESSTIPPLEIKTTHRLEHLGGDGQSPESPFEFEVKQSELSAYIEFVALDDPDITLTCAPIPEGLSLDEQSLKLAVEGKSLATGHPTSFSCQTSKNDVSSATLHFIIRVKHLVIAELQGPHEGARLGEILLSADMTGDGRKDLVASYYTEDDRRRLRIFLNQGNRDLKDIQSIDEIAENQVVEIRHGNGSVGDSPFFVDANGDGIFDIAFIKNSTNCVNGPNLYVIYGRSTGWPSVIDITTDLDGAIGFHAKSNSGCPSVYFEDFDGDGHVDLLMAHQYSRKLLFSNGNPWPASIDMTVGTIDFPSSNNMAMRRAVGDINGDGIPDIIFSSYQPLKFYIFLGGSSLWGNFESRPESIDGSTLDGSNGFIIESVLGGLARDIRVSDVNGDGIGDLVMTGGRTVSTNGDAGAVAVWFGRKTFEPLYSSLSANSLIAVEGHWSQSERTLTKIYSSIDFNGDGIDDLCFVGSGAHKLYCVWGRANWSEPLYRSIDIDGSNGFKVNTGSENVLRLSTNLTSSGNSDMVFAEPHADGGNVHVLFGRSHSLSSYIPFRDLEQPFGFSIKSSQSQQKLGTGTTTFDFDNDGHKDLIISAPDRHSELHSQAGSIFIIFKPESGEWQSLEL